MSTCHIQSPGGLRTLCGLSMSLPPGETYVEYMSRQVMEMPSCEACRRAFHKDKLSSLGEETPTEAPGRVRLVVWTSQDPQEQEVPDLWAAGKVALQRACPLPQIVGMDMKEAVVLWQPIFTRDLLHHYHGFVLVGPVLLDVGIEAREESFP